MTTTRSTCPATCNANGRRCASIANHEGPHDFIGVPHLVWHKGFGSERYAFLGGDVCNKIVELRGLFIHQRFSDRISYKVTEQSTYPSLEAALEAAQA